MKKTLIVLLTLLTLFASFAACGKKQEELDPNAVLTDSDVPLDLGAEFDGTAIDGHTGG